MEKLWIGRSDGQINKQAESFNASISFDKRLYEYDIKGSIAHAKMLSKCDIISSEESIAIINGLDSILNDINNGQLEIDETCEDIHTFIEQTLICRIGNVGKKLHTARSRNDQVALDLRLFLKDETSALINQLKKLISEITDKASLYKSTIMPGYTHLQRAQPIMFGHHILAYASMLIRDVERLKDSLSRTCVSPIGSCALAGTTYSTDRVYEATELELNNICINSIDGVSDRDFVIELLSDFSLIMMHLSRFSEEIILWSSWEFKFIELDNAFTTGSSIMPQKKNSDMAELVRGKTGRVYGHLMGMLTTMKALPLAYDKDMQEDKEAIFDACDTVSACVEIFTGMIATMKAIPENMKKAAQKGFINATDLADYLTKKGMPFRTAYKISGQIVEKCIETNNILETLPIETYKEFSDLFDSDVFEAINIEYCANKRTSEGGTSTASIEKQIKSINDYLKNE